MPLLEHGVRIRGKVVSVSSQFGNSTPTSMPRIPSLYSSNRMALAVVSWSYLPRKIVAQFEPGSNYNDAMPPGAFYRECEFDGVTLEESAGRGM